MTRAAAMLGLIASLSAAQTPPGRGKAELTSSGNCSPNIVGGGTAGITVNFLGSCGGIDPKFLESIRRNIREAVKQALSESPKTVENLNELLDLKKIEISVIQRKLLSTEELVSSIRSELESHTAAGEAEEAAKQGNGEKARALAGKAWRAGHSRAAAQSMLHAYALPMVKLAGPSNQMTAVEFSEDGGRVLTAGWDGTARVWDRASGKELARMVHPMPQVWTAEFSRDGKTVLTVGEGWKARLWEAATGKMLREVGGPEDVAGARLSPDGRLVLTRNGGKKVRVWDADTAEKRLEVEIPATSVWGAAFSRDGKRLLVWGNDSCAQVWVVESGKPEGRVCGGGTAEFFPDGRRVVTWSSNTETATVWDGVGGQRLSEYERPASSGNFLNVSVSADGKLVAAAGNSGTASVWEASSGKGVSEIEGASSVRFLPDGKRLLTVNGEAFPGSTKADYTAKISDAMTGEELVRLGGRRDPIDTAVLSADGKWLAANGVQKLGEGGDLSPRIYRVVAAGDLDEVAAEGKQGPVKGNR